MNNEGSCNGIDGRNLDAVEKDSLGNLFDKERQQNNSSQKTLSAGTASANVIFGQVTLSNSKPFSITTEHDLSQHHRLFDFSSTGVSVLTSNEQGSSSLYSLDKINLSTQESSSSSMARIDSALAMISEMRSEMGAKNVRFQSIANNLDQAQAALRLPDDKGNDFMIFAAERGFTLEDFADQTLTS